MSEEKKEVKAPEPVKKAEPVKSGKVKILSHRIGDIMLKGGVVIKNNSVHELEESVVKYLEQSFPGAIRRL